MNMFASLQRLACPVNAFPGPGFDKHDRYADVVEDFPRIFDPPHSLPYIAAAAFGEYDGVRFVDADELGVKAFQEWDGWGVKEFGGVGMSDADLADAEGVRDVACHQFESQVSIQCGKYDGEPGFVHGRGRIKYTPANYSSSSNWFKYNPAVRICREAKAPGRYTTSATGLPNGFSALLARRTTSMGWVFAAAGHPNPAAAFASDDERASPRCVGSGKRGALMH